MSNRASWRQKIPWARLLGLVMLGVLLARLDLATLMRIVQRADWSLLVMAVLLNLPMIFFKSLRWQTLMRSQGIQYSVGQAYLVYFGSIFIGFLTPGRLGEFVKAIHVNQDCGVPVGRALSGVLADRLFDLYILLLVGGTALLTLALDNTGIAALVGSILLLTVPLVLFLNNRTFDWIQRASFKLGRLSQKIFAPGAWFPELRLGLRQLKWPWLLIAIVLTVFAYLTFFGQCYLLALALQLPLGIVQVSFAVALGSLVTLIPISISGLGTREGAIVAYLGTLGVLAETALGFSLSVFLNFYVAGGLMGAVAWWLKPIPLTGVKAKMGDLLQPIGRQ